MAQTYLNSDATRQLNQSLGDINTWYEKFQPHELEKLDSFLNDYNTDFKYRGATDRALAGISGQLGPNVVGAGALPNLRAGAAGLASGQAALVGGTAVDAQLGQQQNYAQALQKVVQAGHAHKNLADYGIQNNSQKRSARPPPRFTWTSWAAMNRRSITGFATSAAFRWTARPTVRSTPSRRWRSWRST